MLLNFIIPIYQKDSNEIDINIINNKENLHITINDELDFLDKISQYLSQDNIYYLKTQIYEYAINYYSKFDEEKFKKLYLINK